MARSPTALDRCIIRLMDLGAASVGLAVTGPLMVGLLPLVGLTIAWPPLYVSRRVGMGGRTFRHVKIATMRPGPSVGRVFFETHRIPPLGRLLRRLHLDELPELVHILLGQMSLVGPRPLPRHLLEGLDTSRREGSRPGWTGLAQCWLMEHGTLDKHRQIALDDELVATLTPRRYLSIVADTLRGVLVAAPPDLSPRATAARRAFGASIDEDGA